MMKVLVGSKNPVKIDAVKESFSHYFDDCTIIPHAVSSGVNSQPIGKETFDGACNRAKALKEKGDADYYIGIEGGIIKEYDIWFEVGVVCIMDNDGKVHFGTSPQFMLPSDIIEKLLSGSELGDLMDTVTNVQNSKQKDGAIGFLSKGVMKRKDLYVSGIIAALVAFLNKELYYKR